MHSEIGEAAGVIWRYLDGKGSTRLRRLREATELPEPLVYMGLGWLAREGLVTFEKEKRSLLVALRRP
jgi:hypothetical protein